MMITEDYVSFETAKLLKEKGFPQYKREDGFAGLKYNMDGELTTAPYAEHYRVITQTIAMKWLREIKALHIMVDCIGTKNYLPTVQNTKNSNDYKVEAKYSKLGGNGFDSYEQACEAAIKYCLENLI